MLKEDIIKWVKKQDYWMQVIADSILKGNKLSAKEIEEIYVILKQEYKLSNEPLIKKNLEFLTQEKIINEEEGFKWSSISEIKFVNALRTGEVLNIGNQMTLIYGENGSGKSSYTRIFNNAFISRGDKKILPNIYKNEKIEPPSANFTFTDKNGDSIKKKFPEDRNDNLFNSVAVFDTSSALNDLTKESELSFVPMEFNFFEEFTSIFQNIKSLLNTEISNNQRENDFVNYFENDSSIKNTVKRINGYTNINELENLSNTEELKDLYKQNIKRKANLQSLNIDKKLLEYNRFVRELNTIEGKVELLNNKYSEERINKTHNLLSDRETFKKLSSKEGIELFKDYDIYNLGSNEWKNFINAAKDYNDSINKEVERCLLCGQSIKNIDVIEKYWEYLKSTVEEKLNRTDEKIEKIKNDFTSHTFNLIEEKSQLEEWLLEYQPEFLKMIKETETSYKNANQAIVECLETYNWKNDVHFKELDTSSFEKIYKFIEGLKKQLDYEKVNTELVTIQKFLNDYDDKLKLEKLLPEIKEYINNLNWIHLAKSINLSTQKITTCHNSLFTKYVTQNYINSFNEECKNLNANLSAEIKQRGRAGATFSRLTIKGKNPIDILSEGEQRSIALANFLAETRLNKNNTCAVFDDPVSSLDHKRRELIADRLVKEAKYKKVVILTHDIAFFLAIFQKCKSFDIECSTVTIKKLGIESGLVLEDTEPWIGMTVKNRIKKLNQELQEIRKFYNSIDSISIVKVDEYEVKVKSWFGRLRETWERIVEEILFNGSVQRFNPAIQTQKLKKVIFTQELYKEVELGMTNCSKYVHDRSMNLGENILTPDELQVHLDDCNNFVKKTRNIK